MQRLSRERNQLSLCPQKIALETTHACAHQRGHTTSQSLWYSSGNLHRWASPSNPCRNLPVHFVCPRIRYRYLTSMQVLSSFDQRAETHRCKIRLRPTKHDSCAYDPHLQSRPQDHITRSPRDRRKGCPRSGRSIRAVHATLRHGPPHDRRRSTASIPQREGRARPTLGKQQTAKAGGVDIRRRGAWCCMSKCGFHAST